VILAIYALISTALFYLGSRALITRALWEAYPPWLTKLMDCPACVGFWWGMIMHLVSRRLDLDVGPLPIEHPASPVLVGLCMLVLTPIVAGFMQHGLDLVGTVAPEPPGVAPEAATLVLGEPAHLEQVRARLEALTGDQVLDVIDRCIGTGTGSPAAIHGLSDEDLCLIRAHINAYAQAKLIDGNTWRGRLG
jgi:hypothetical protein